MFVESAIEPVRRVFRVESHAVGRSLIDVGGVGLGHGLITPQVEVDRQGVGLLRLAGGLRVCKAGLGAFLTGAGVLLVPAAIDAARAKHASAGQGEEGGSDQLHGGCECLPDGLREGLLAIVLLAGLTADER